VRLEDLEQPVHVLRGFFRVLFEIELVAAGAERRGGRVAQAIDGFRFLIVDVDEVFIEDAKDAVGGTIDFFDVLMAACFLDTPARLALITDVGPPDCPTNKLPANSAIFYFR